MLNQNELDLLKQVAKEFRENWHPNSVQDTIGSKQGEYRWDHVRVQGFLCNIGEKLGFGVGCEKYKKWDVAWVKGKTRVHIEIESQLGKIGSAFGKICKTFDKSSPHFEFLGVLVVGHYLEGKNIVYNDYFFEKVLSEINGACFPETGQMGILIIEAGSKVRYRIAEVGPPNRTYTIIEECI